MNRNNPYSVPKGYFSDLQKNISQRVQSIEQTPTQIEPLDFELEEQPPISWGQAWRQMIGFAAAFALLVGIGWVFVYFASDDKQITGAAKQDAAIMDTARILWVLEEQDVVSIVEHHQNEEIIMAKATAEYFAFFGEADDVNLIIYD